MLVGIISIFLIPKEKKKRNDCSIFSLIYGTVKVKEIKKNKYNTDYHLEVEVEQVLVFLQLHF